VILFQKLIYKLLLSTFIFHIENYKYYLLYKQPMAKGRPVKSEIRQNIVEILYFMKEGYGYGIYKVYVAIFPKVTMRSIYYHLKKGVILNEFKVSKVEKVKGDYSWGPEAEKIYYGLGDAAKPISNEKVKEYFDKNK